MRGQQAGSILRGVLGSRLPTGAQVLACSAGRLSRLEKEVQQHRRGIENSDLEQYQYLGNI